MKQQIFWISPSLILERKYSDEEHIVIYLPNLFLDESLCLVHVFIFVIFVAIVAVFSTFSGLCKPSIKLIQVNKVMDNSIFKNGCVRKFGLSKLSLGIVKIAYLSRNPEIMILMETANLKFLDRVFISIFVFLSILLGLLRLKVF